MIKESVTVAVDVSAARLVNELRKCGVPIRKVRKIGAKTQVTIDKTYSRKTFAFFDEMCYTYTVVRYDGLLSTLKRGLVRAGIFVGLAVFLGLYAFMYGFIWRVEIDGASHLSVKTVIDRAASFGAKRGARKNIDLSRLEADLRSTDGIVECTAMLRGVTLKLSIIEDTAFVPVKEGRADIVSDCDGEVTRVVCERGTPRVKVGDRIAAGAVLIEGAGYSTMGDDYGNPVLLEEYPARGTVYGKTVLSETVVLPPTSVTLVDTGNSKRATVLSLFGWKIGKAVSPYAVYRVEKSASRLEPIPVGVTSIRFYEVEPVTTEADPDAAVAMLTARLTELAELKGGKAVETTHTVKRDENGFTVSVYVSAEIIFGSA